MRFASFDIECTQLEASYGRLVCACFKFHDEEKVRTQSCRYFKQEKKLCQWIHDMWNDLDVVVTVNGKMFDIPFVNARLMHHGFLPLEPKMHVDLRWIGKKLRFRGASLDGMAKDLKLCNQKYDVPAAQWVLAAEGNTKAIKEIIRHCEKDVLMTEELFKRLEPLIIRITK